MRRRGSSTRQKHGTTHTFSPRQHICGAAAPGEGDTHRSPLRQQPRGGGVNPPEARPEDLIIPQPLFLRYCGSVFLSIPPLGPGGLASISSSLPTTDFFFFYCIPTKLESRCWNVTVSASAPRLVAAGTLRRALSSSRLAPLPPLIVSGR